MRKLNYLQLFFSLIFLSTGMLSAQTTWTGNTNADWGNPGNWTAGVPDAADDVIIPGVATNDPVILSGTVGEAKSVTLTDLSKLTVQSGGQLFVDGGNGIRFFGGELDNTGEVFIGLHQLIASNAITISSGGSIVNNPGGLIQIEEASANGVYMNDGSLINAGTIKVGVNKKVGVNGFFITNSNTITNTLGATIQIEETGSNGFKLAGGATVSNAGTITLGVNKKVDAIGFWISDQSAVTNAAGATIQIEETGSSGFRLADGVTVVNAGTITLGVNKKVGGDGFNITDQSVLTNAAGATIQIDETLTQGIFSNFLIDNSGSIILGLNKKIGGKGIYNVNGTVNNHATGTIQIEETGSHGYHSYNGIATDNYGTITLGVNKKVGLNGIYNDVCGNSPFHNHAGGVIQVEEIRFHGIINTNCAVMINEGTITIGVNKPVGFSGLFNFDQATFNNNGGLINIDRTPQVALVNIARYSNLLPTFTNQASIIIGGVASGGTSGISNTGNFHNNAGGEIKIDQTVNHAIFNTTFNQLAGNFTNLAAITIGASAPVGSFGIENQANFFNNGGEIKIDRATNGLKNTFGTFFNGAALTIGMNGGTMNDGISNHGTFTNSQTGEINVDYSSASGILNKGWFVNQGAITLDPNAGSGITGLFNFSSFTNSACASFTSFVPILISGGTINNAGLFTINTANGHGNTAGAFFNNGVIVYPQGNPVPGVTNNDLIVAPIAGECLLADALQIGGFNSFAISTNWYTDPGLGNVAGNYAPNTFSITNLSEGSHTLYFTASGNGCSFTPSIQVDHDDVTPPEPLCKTGTVELGPDGNYNLTENDVFDGGTDNCGSVNFVSMSHSSVSCADLNTIIEVTVNTNDGKGNDNSCTANLTVVDNTPPSINCPAAITADVDAGICCATLSIPAPTGSDNCTTLTFSNDYNETGDASDIYFPGETIVTWTATDGSGHTTTCEQSVIVEDNEAPVLGYAEETCYAEYEICLDEQAAFIEEQLAALEEFIENCNGDPACLQEAANEAMKIDENARKELARCYFILRGCEVIPAVNNTLPVIEVNVPNGSCEIELSPGPVVMENCATFTLTNDFNSNGTGEGMYPVGTVFVTWTAVDQYGNTSTVTRSITVVDAEDPVIDCPDIIVDNDPGVCGATVTFEATATDNCGVATLDYSPASGGFFPIGSTTVNATATDEAGNDASCTFTVTVNGEGDADCDDVPDGCDVCPGGDDNGPCNAESFPGFENIPAYWQCHPNGNKVSICHNGNTLCVSINAVQAHLNHGDFLGPCTSCQQPLAAPNTGFNTATATAEQVELELFPNPANREVNVHLHGLEGEAATLTVFDNLGREVHRQQLDGSDRQLRIDLRSGGFANGRYIVRVVSGQSVVTKPFVIQF